jgi:protein phosphatase-4 regulatory subunit 3
MTQAKLFEPILKIVVETMPRDNLLNSACLEFFEFIKKENIKNIISHLVENYRDTLQQITYVETFSNFIMRYDQSEGFAPSLESSFMDNDDTPRRPEAARGSRWEAGIKDLDAQEEEYFNTSDDEDEGAVKVSGSRSVNGASPLSKPLVDYPSDEENENMDIEASTGSDENTPPKASKTTTVTPILSNATLSPPEKVSEKRRREDEDEDEMSKLSHPKRRNSTSSIASNSSSVLRRKKSFNTSQHNGASPAKPQKISISISQAIKSGGESSGDDSGT